MRLTIKAACITLTLICMLFLTSETCSLMNQPSDLLVACGAVGVVVEVIAYTLLTRYIVFFKRKERKTDAPTNQQAS